MLFHRNYCTEKASSAEWRFRTVGTALRRGGEICQCNGKNGRISDGGSLNTGKVFQRRQHDYQG